MIYDAIIIGAGPAGLSLGSELSKKHKILVIEKNKEISTTKEWTTEKRILVKAGLSKYISVEFNKCYLKSFKTNKFFLHDDLVSVDKNAVLNHFKRIIQKNRSRVVSSCKFLRLISRKDNKVTIKTTKGKYSAKLVIDCCGIESGLAKEHDIYKREFYFPVYGGVYNINQEEYDPCLLESLIKRFPVSWIEVFPLTKTECVFYTCQYLAHNLEPSKLKRAHSYHVKNGYLRTRLSNKPMVREVYGVIPMGMNKKHAIDNIFFFGDSGLIAAPVIGGGFTTVLQHYKKFAKHLSERISTNTLSEGELEYKFSEIEQINRNIQLISGLVFVHASPVQIDLLFEGLSKLPNRIVWDIIFLRLKPKDLILFVELAVKALGLEGLAKLLPKEEFLFIAKESMKIFEEIAIEEIEELTHRYHDSI